MAPATPTVEYIARIAFIISIGAFATDLMLPALDQIATDLKAVGENQGHIIVTAFFLGMSFGQLVVGPLSDSWGRKPVVFLGYAIFLAGCILSFLAESWGMMLVARVMQGFGAAAPRVITVALVRDEYKGAAMARVMSLAMAVFIIVPILAPAIGQSLIYVGGWRSTFLALIIFAGLACAWFALRQAETLTQANRRPFRLKSIAAGVWEIIRNRQALGYTLAAGFMFGTLLGYLGSAQQIFQTTFKTGDLFVFYFALSSVALGIASLSNARMVMRLGMVFLTTRAMIALSGLSFGFLALLPLYAGIPPLWMFLTWQLSAFFCVGLVFGNLNALALEPLGHMAGLASSFVGAMAGFICLPLASFIGQRYDGTIYPLVTGFAVLSLAGLAAAMWAQDRS